MRKVNILAKSTLGGLIGFSSVGLIESLTVLSRNVETMWSLPFEAMLLYGMVGFVIGAGCGVGFLALTRFKEFKDITYFTTVGTFSTSVAMLGIILYSWLPELGLNPLTPKGLVVSLLIFALSAVLSSLIIFLLYKIASTIYKKPALTIFILYLVIFIVTGIVATALTESSYSFQDYNPKANSQLKQKPNVILIIIDCLRYDMISPNSDKADTPTISALADDGILFKNVIATSYWTRPTITSIMASRLPFDHGVLTYTTSLPENLRILPEELSDNGYRTVGISANPNIKPQTGFHRGFHEFRFEKIPLPLFSRAVWLENYQHILAALLKVVPWVRENYKSYMSGDKLTESAIRWITEKGEDKFFMYLHYMEPHAPYYSHQNKGVNVKPREDADVSNLERYLSLYKGEVEANDMYLNPLIEFLKKSQLYDNTMIMLTADHGEEFYEHYGWEHRGSPYEEIVHVPMIIKMPYSKNAGTVNRALISEIDLAPSILGYLNFDIPLTWAGNNFLSGDFSNEYVLIQGLNEGGTLRAMRTMNYKLSVSDSGFFASKFKGFRNHTRPSLEIACPSESFYDLNEDPEEKINRIDAPEYAALVEKYLTAESTFFWKPEINVDHFEKGVIDKKTLRELKALGYVH
ncbi:MAG: sulfatase-like hydrolase/transferase [candidate division Zixibacteria bacterium]|nr:sulfatase-like hydrolase/transferase [candidate division Zixibacteria bacterium]